MVKICRFLTATHFHCFFLICLFRSRSQGPISTGGNGCMSQARKGLWGSGRCKPHPSNVVPKAPDDLPLAFSPLPPLLSPLLFQSSVKVGVLNIILLLLIPF